MQILINIPNEEFGIDIDDKFQDFFKRLKAEINRHMINNTNLVCGAYELETIDMFLEAFEKSSILPKGHGRLIDADEVEELEEMLCATECGCCVLDGCFYDQAEIIIEADRSEKE